LALVYVAKRLKEALRLEELLTAAGLEYLVEPDKYRGGIIFPPSGSLRSSTSHRRTTARRAK
jgi:hypothetical protein